VRSIVVVAVERGLSHHPSTAHTLLLAESLVIMRGGIAVLNDSTLSLGEIGRAHV